LESWWGDKLLSDVTIKTCADYVAFRGKPVARRELEDLKAAINYHAALGLHRDVVKVTLPPPGPPRMRWLTRDEAARLIWAAWKFREVHEAPYRVRYSRRHIARFALVALYTGSRAAAVCGARLEPTRDGGWIDLESGVFHRRGEDEIETNKRRPPVRLSGNLLAHLRRWRLSGQTYAVEWCGKPIATIEKGFARACADAGLVGVSPHALRHTAATWQMQAGTPIWEAAGFLGMTTETLERVYGHHHPDFQRSAAENMRVKRSAPSKRSGPSSSPSQKEKSR
jgi:integrase